nr:amidase 1 [Quercus suber]
MATELFTDKQMVLNARSNLTEILPVQDLRIFNLGNARYLAEPVAKTINVPGLDSHPERISLITIVVVPSDPDEAGKWLGRLVQQWLELDDVLTSDFLDSVLLVQADEHQGSSRNVHTSVVMRKEWGISHITTVSKSSLAMDLAPGPYVFWKGELCRPYRLYDDPNIAFVVASQSQEGKRFISGPRPALCTKLVDHTSVASRRPLAGLRFAVKDIFDIAGIRTTAGCRAFFDLSCPSVTTAPAVQTLVNQGAVLLGILKLGSLVTREEPTESVDYHAAFDPRGDGYQSAWSSSGASGAAIAAYDWLDFTIATDTTGSSRRPAMADGLFSIRLSKDAVPTDGIVPSWKSFENIIGSWIARATHNTDEVRTIVIASVLADYFKLPISLVYPTDFWPIDNEQQMKLVHDFVSDFEKAHGTDVKKISIVHEWSISRPKEAGSLSIQEYLENVRT